MLNCLTVIQRSVVLLAVAAAFASCLLSWRVLGLIPHVPDELSYLFQGRVLASGKLYTLPPEVPEAFTVAWDHILRTPESWRAMYPPGWPLLLATGWWLRAPWLINPLLLFLSVLGVYSLATRLYDQRTALFASIAFVSSPFVLLMSSGFMSHPSVLCAGVWCAFFLARAGRKDLLAAGFIGAYAFASRPYTSVPLLLPFVIWTLLKAQNKKMALVHLVSGALPLVVLFGVYNQVVFGSPVRTGYSYDPDATFYGSLLQNYFENIPWYVSRLNEVLWGWPWPDLLIFVPLLLPPFRTWKVDLLLGTPFLALLSAYAVFYYTDIVYGGPRYIFEALGFVSILAGRSVRIVEERLSGSAPALRRGILYVLLLLFIYPLVITLPERIQYHDRAYHGQSHELLDLVDAQPIGENALILISGDPYVFRTFYLENSLNPADSARVFARDIPEKRDAIMKAYQRDQIWSLNIQLVPLDGVNRYKDRFEIGSVKFTRLK